MRGVGPMKLYTYYRSQAAFRVRLANRLQDLGFGIERKRDDFELAGLPADLLRPVGRARLVDAWFAASRSELRESGYWSGVVRCFSISAGCESKTSIAASALDATVAGNPFENSCVRERWINLPCAR